MRQSSVGIRLWACQKPSNGVKGVLWDTIDCRPQFTMADFSPYGVHSCASEFTFAPGP